MKIVFKRKVKTQTNLAKGTLQIQFTLGIYLVALFFMPI